MFLNVLLLSLSNEASGRFSGVVFDKYEDSLVSAYRSGVGIAKHCYQYATKEQLVTIPSSPSIFRA